MLRLKQAIDKTDITQAELARVAGCSASLLCRIINRAEFPVSGSLQKQIKRNISDYLRQRKIPVRGIWQKINNKGVPRKRAPNNKKEEVKMLPQKLLNDLNLAKDPFSDEIHRKEDIWMPEQFEEAEATLLLAARRQAFFMLTGKTGSGKSVVIKIALDKLFRDDTYKLIRPEPMGTERLNAGSICDAIIFELEGPDAKTKRCLEAKARKVRYKLEALCKEGKKVILIIDEAHCLHHNTLRALKRLYEFELGFRKMIGIILIGQESLHSKLREHPDMLEVRNRLQGFEMPAINGQVPQYIRHKIERANGDPNIFDDLALQEIARKSDTPLQANVNAGRALLLAWDDGIWEKGVNKVSIQYAQES